MTRIRGRRGAGSDCRKTGKSWPDFVTIAQHPNNELYYWDVHLAQHPDSGRWVVLPSGLTSRREDEMSTST